MNRREMYYEYYSFLPRNPKGLKAKLLSKLDYLLGVDYYMKDFDCRRHYEEMGEGIGDFGDPDSALLGVGIPGLILYRLLVLLLSPILMPVHQIRVVVYDLRHKPVEVFQGDNISDIKGHARQAITYGYYEAMWMACERAAGATLAEINEYFEQHPEEFQTERPQ